MNAISLLQTQKAFLKMAQKSIHGLKKIFYETESQTESKPAELGQTARFSQLSSFVIDVLNRTQKESVQNVDLRACLKMQKI